jgi:UDP:flavonoid glycosyltransferase YjiC (YdhE family)
MVSAPMLGHLLPMVPLARALRAAGHEVRLAAAADALAVADPDLAVEDIAPAFDFGRIIRRMLLRHPLVARAELAGRAGTRGVGLLFGAVNAQLAEGVNALADQFAPDLVIHDPLAPAGAVAAARLGVPAVVHENSLFAGADLVQAVSAGQYRLPPAATLTIAPPSLVGTRPGWPMRAVPHSGSGTVPDWLTRPAGQPRLLVSRSTVAGPGGGALMSAVVAAASGLAVEIVLVRPDRRVMRRGGLPDNVRTVGWVPLAEVLPGCAAIVHHGGAGTVLAAFAAGVPQLVVPGAGDRTHNARLVADRGAGLAVPASRIAAADLVRLLDDPRLRAATEAVRQEMAAMPEPARLVPRLTALAR